MSNKDWIIQGNVAIPTGNPFLDESTEERSEEEHTATNDALHAAEDRVVLGPGLVLLLNHTVEVVDGVIVQICPTKDFATFASKAAGPSRLTASLPTVVELGPHEFLVPGLIDLHIHAPQYSYTGTATDRPLMGPDGWLETYTFPAEQRLTDLTQARDVYDTVVQTTLRHGTTTALYFATLHLEPTKVLVDVALQHGQRALIGKVAMDRNAPETYVQSLEQNVTETQQLIEYIHQRAGRQHASPPPPPPTQQLLPLVLPVVMPRFIPTCTPQLLSALGDMAKHHRCHITTHLSESPDEVEFSRHLDATVDGGDGRTDAQILDQHGLLTLGCVLAHSVHLSQNDQELLKSRNAAIAHCPLSNFFFAGGCLPTKQLLQCKNRIGLGTDVAGGYSPSMWNASRMAVLASQVLQQHQQHQQHQHCTSCTPTNNEEDAPPATAGVVNHVLDYRHAFYLATLGGARALGLEDRIGTLRVGLEFDAIVLSASSTHSTSSVSPVHVFASDTVGDIFQKLCVLGDDRNVQRVFVQGRDVTVR